MSLGQMIGWLSKAHSDDRSGTPSSRRLVMSVGLLVLAPGLLFFDLAHAYTTCHSNADKFAAVCGISANWSTCFTAWIVALGGTTIGAAFAARPTDTTASPRSSGAVSAP